MAFLSVLVVVTSLFASGEPTEKPPLETLLKPRSIELVKEKMEVLTNADWEDAHFSFTDAVLVRAPKRMTRAKLLDFASFKELTSAIKQADFDPKTQILELAGEAGGLALHSWVKVDQSKTDELTFDFVRGDMAGFKIKAYLYETGSHTLLAAKGFLPEARTRFPKLVAFAFPTIVEFVLGGATKNFRNVVESDYNKQRVLH